MITVDNEQGIATDHGEIWIGDAEDGLESSVTFAIDNDDLIISYNNERKERVNIFVPVERFKKLLAYQ